MKMHRLLASNSDGAAIVEFAIALPIVVLFIYGIFVVGELFFANAGMQNALGEGARYATLYVSASPHVPTDSEIQSKMSTASFGTGNCSPFTATSSAGGTGYKNLSVSCTLPTNFIFFTGPSVTMTKTKRVYTAV